MRTHAQRDENGKPYILNSVLKAEDILHQKKLDKEYLPITVRQRPVPRAPDTIDTPRLVPDRRETPSSSSSRLSSPTAKTAKRCKRDE
jgi:hypothetical protein